MNPMLALFDMNPIVLFAAWFTMGMVGFLVGQSRGREPEGVVFGMFLGPLGWLIVAAGPDHRPKCPACRGAVKAGAVKCCHCGEVLPAPAPRAPRPPAQATLRSVRCPACDAENHITPAEYTGGLKCAQCATGFVPAAR